MDRYELDRAAQVHGYEPRESEPPCEKCIHQPMCDGVHCHFDRKWEPGDLKKKYYIVNDADERVNDELFSMRDLSEKDLGEYLTSESDDEWRRSHPSREYKVRLTIEMRVNARDRLEAKKSACMGLGLYDADTTELGPYVLNRLADVDIIQEYRMPVQYNCCESGREYGYKYTWAKSPREAKFKFMDEWVDDIESSPCFDDIEVYEESDREWYPV